MSRGYRHGVTIHTYAYDFIFIRDVTILKKVPMDVVAYCLLKICNAPRFQNLFKLHRVLVLY